MLTKLRFVRKDGCRTFNLYQCSCGNTKEIFEGNVNRGFTKSCGCLRKKNRVLTGLPEDLKNKKFGLLKALSLTKTNKTGTHWKCICDCGNSKIVSARNLKTGATKSCGCLCKISKKEQFKNHKYVTKNKLYPKWQNIKKESDWTNFRNFETWAIKDGYNGSNYIHRKDKSKNWSETNCYISTSKYILKVRLPKTSKVYPDITDLIIGELFAVKRIKNNIWLWQCSCGKQIKGTEKSIQKKVDKSCGHFKRESKKLSTRWQSMRKRCYQKNHRGYHRYGGRGITICDEWLEDCTKFYKWALENGFKSELQLDRIDNNKGYSPDNCRWVTRKQNSRNRSTNKLITYNNQTKILIEWAEELGINYKILQDGLKRGYKFENLIGGGQLEVNGLDNQKYKLQLINKNPENISSLHKRVREILKSVFPDYAKYEEISLPGSSIKNSQLRCDFIIPNKRLIIEVDGAQHSNGKGFMDNDYEYSKLKDRNKEKWAKLNNFKLIRLPFDENEEQWKDRIIQLLPNKTIFEFKQKGSRRNLNYDTQYEYCGQFKTMREWADTLGITKYTLDKHLKETNNILDNRVISPALFYCDAKFAWAEKIKLNGELLYIWEWSKKLGRPEEEIVSDFQNNKSIFEIFQLKS